MTQLSKIPVLDYGYVRFVASSIPAKELDLLKTRGFSGNGSNYLVSLPQITLEIRMPYTVLLSMTAYCSSMVPYADANKDLVWKPSVADIKAPTLEESKVIADSIVQTLDALMVNQHSYLKDGCQRGIASLTTPVAAYWEGMTMMSLDQAIRFATAKGTGRIVSDYQSAIMAAIEVEFKNVNELIGRVRQ